MIDLKLAFRQLLKHPGFTAVAVLTLALGIGANTALFSVVNGVLLKPLPCDEPGRLVQAFEAPQPGQRNAASPGAFLDWREHATVFEDLSLRQDMDMNLTGDGEPERVSGLGMSAGVIRKLPLGGWPDTSSFSIIGRPDQPQSGHLTDFDFCTPDYFRAAGIPLLRGRTFEPRDKPGAPGVVIINEALAREHFPHEDPLGQRIHLEVFTGKLDEGWEIVGVAGDVRQRGLGEEARPCVYRPQPFSFWGGEYLAIRTAGSPLSLATAVRKAVLEVDPSQPVVSIRTLEEVLAASVAQRRFVLMLLGGFSGSALLLAAIGLYGVIACAVSQRTREIGIRMALGARRGDVLGLALGGGMKLAGIGVALGIVGALGLTRVLAAQLYEVKPTDPATFVAVVLVLLLVALLACWLPARRAARVDPMEALRAE